MLLKDVCVLDVFCCGRSTGIIEAARLMRRHHCGDLVVVDDGDEDRVPVGILTDRDIVVEVLGNELDASRTMVGEVMSRNLVIAQDTEDTSIAIERMHAHGVRRLPVVNHAGTLVGVYTLDDAMKLQAARATELVEIAAKAQAQEHRARR